MTDVAEQAQALFSRHLDLKPLRHRRRGNVRCCFHDDCTASLSVDIERGLFHCFGCGARGGVSRFAELVGEVADRRQAMKPRALNHDGLRAFIREEALRQAWARPSVAELYELSDHLRSWRRFIATVRRDATDTPAQWDRLQLAARAEREAVDLERNLDERPVS